VTPATPAIRGYDFNAGVDFDKLMAAMMTTGFQATALGQAVEEVNRMVSSAVEAHVPMSVALEGA
jgi:deoxyhypusine synthase